MLFATVAFNVHLYGVVPKGFFPQWTRDASWGFIDADQRTPSSMQGKLARFVAILQTDPAKWTTWSATPVAEAARATGA